tara:strand:+ start:604 stop:798 length:195 start_codon:yes stop_codon:yes gene_type:complete
MVKNIKLEWLKDKLDDASTSDKEKLEIYQFFIDSKNALDVKQDHKEFIAWLDKLQVLTKDMDDE